MVYTPSPQMFRYKMRNAGLGPIADQTTGSGGMRVKSYHQRPHLCMALEHILAKSP